MVNDIRLEDLHPTYQQIARIIGLENVIKLGRELGGEQFYLPKLDVCLSRVKARKIIEEFKCGNYGELARKYRVTSFWVREVVRKHQREMINKKQAVGPLQAG
ncbi:MAG: DNA-binding protein [Candidatus Brocadia sp.]|nr:MAG: DNA-binding protein [Candidatus Brocadia sp.]